jgi:hypothetical protein
LSAAGQELVKFILNEASSLTANTIFGIMQFGHSYEQKRTPDGETLKCHQAAALAESVTLSLKVGEISFSFSSSSTCFCLHDISCWTFCCRSKQR